MIFSTVVFASVSVAYILWELGVPKNADVRDILKDFVDVSPCVLVLFFCRPWAAWFLCLCLMANVVIYDNRIFGGVLFIAAYASASIFASWFHSFDAALAFTGFFCAACVSLPISFYYKGDARFKAVIPVYSLLAVAPLLYAFGKTLNFGFLCLVLGDIGLGIYGGCEKKWVKVAANILYFAGTCFVPLSL